MVLWELCFDNSFWGFVCKTNICFCLGILDHLKLYIMNSFFRVSLRGVIHCALSLSTISHRQNPLDKKLYSIVVRCATYLLNLFSIQHPAVTVGVWCRRNCGRITSEIRGLVGFREVHLNMRQSGPLSKPGGESLNQRSTKESISHVC